MPLRFSPASGAAVLSLRAAPNAGVPLQFTPTPASVLSLRIAPVASVSISSFTRGPAGPAGINTAFKTPCIVATTAAILLTGTQTIDGVVLVAGNRVLVKDQSDGTTNGVYTVAASNWARSSDADESSEWLEGTMVYVTRGTAFARTLWALTTTGTITVGNSSMSFTLVTASPTTT